MDDQDSATDSGIEVRTYFARERNALVARADFGELYAALYLHQMDCGIRLEQPYDDLLRDALAALTLHCASRPWGETCAWTIHFQNPLTNVFVNGDNRLGTVVGNMFIDNVRSGDSGLFYSDSVEDGRPLRRSVVEFEGNQVFPAAEKFYSQSEQRPTRFFRHDEEDIVMIAAQPDCDLEWLAGLDTEAVKRLDKEVELALLEKRHYRFECGCNHQRMVEMLAPVMSSQPDELFADEETVRVKCPRCGMTHAITREAMEAYLQSQKG